MASPSFINHPDYSKNSKTISMVSVVYDISLSDLNAPHLVAPNGMVYVKPEVRKGLLARMLTELLDTRVMVKQAMKGTKDDKVHQPF